MFVPFRQSFAIEHVYDAGRLATFAVVGVGTSFATNRMRRALARTRISEERFRRTLLDSPFPMALYREDGAIVALSNSWCALSGHPASAISTIDAWVAHANPERQDETREIFQRIARMDEAFDGGEHSIQTASGSVRTWALRASPMGCDEEGLRLTLLVADDITERKRAEQDRADAQARLQATIDSITDGLLILDRNWRFTYVSETGAGIIGMHSQDLLGRCVWDLFPGAVNLRFHAEYHTAAEIGRPVHFEDYYPAPVELWLECHCYPSQEGLSVYFRDITARKRVEDTLRRRTAELDALLENAPIGFAFFDRQHCYVRLNGRLAEMNGLSVADHLGRPVRDVMPANADSVEAALAQVFQTSQAVQLEIATHAPKEAGGLRHWLTGFYPVCREGGHLESVGAFAVEITSLRRAEQALRETTERLQLALDSARMGTFDIALPGNELSWDERSRALFGLGPDEATSYAVAFSRMHPDDRSRTQEAIRRACDPESEGRYEAEFRLIWPDGTIRWIVGVGRVYFDRTGDVAKPARFTGINHDVTARKVTELALAESEERFRIAAGAAQLGLAEWDAATDRFFWHNHRMFEIFGRTEEEGPMSPAEFRKEWMHADDGPEVDRAFTAARGSGETLRVSFRICHGSGDERWLKLEGVFRHGPDGRLAGLLAIVQDITEARRLEQAVRDNEAYLTAVFEALPVGVGTADSSGRSLTMNRAGLRLHGFRDVSDMLLDLDQYRDHFELRYLDGELMPPEEWPIARALRGDYVNDCEVLLRQRSAGTEYVVAYTAVPVRAGQDGVTAFVMHDVTQRRDAERRIRASEGRYRALFESIDEGFCVVQVLFDENGEPYDYRFAEANPAFERHSGIRQPVGKTAREAMPGLDESWFRIYGKVAVTGESVRFQNDAPALRRFFDVFAFRLGAPGDRQVAILFTDITMRRQIEAATQEARREAESERRLLDAILDALPVGVIITDRRGRLVRWNRASADLWGMHGVAPATPADIAEYRNWRGWWADTGRPIEPEEWAMARTLLKGERATGELVEIERFDGTGRRVMVNMSAPVLDESGTIIAAVVAQTDVTDRIAMERALRESEDKFRTISDNIPQLASMLDESGTLLWQNRRWIEYSGLNAETLLHLAAGHRAPDASLAHPDDRDLIGGRWDAALRSGDPYEVEFRCRRFDGTYRWFLSRAVAIRDDRQTIVRWFATSTDIHEQKNTEAALRRSNEDLQQFAYVSSHDLQEPLRTVVSFSQLLSRRYQSSLDAEARQYLAYVAEAAERMSNLVRDLLIYSRATRDLDRTPTVVSLDSVADDALSLLRVQLEEAGALIERDPLPTVMGDRLQLLQVFQNLVSNALKYRRPNVRPEIRIHAEQRTSEWLVSVADNGEGFGQEYAERIFGLFKRLHGKEVPGTGIGLAVCKTVIERHGGRIWAESRVGVGSIFFLTLPVADTRGDQQ